MNTKNLLLIKNLSVVYKHYNNTFLAVKNVSFNLNKGEILAILGPSGCGKSTIFKTIAGFTRPSGGEILMKGKEIIGPGTDRGIVFQDYWLFPWKSVTENVAFGLKIKKIDKKERGEKADEYLKQLGVASFRKNFPFQLSCGMQQRVALARAMINNPEILLLDEPFGSLDAQNRILARIFLLNYLNKNTVSSIIASHDIEESIFLADRIIVLSSSPAEVVAVLNVAFERPRKIEIINDSKFLEIKSTIFSLLKLK